MKETSNRTEDYNSNSTDMKNGDIILVDAAADDRSVESYTEDVENSSRMVFISEELKVGSSSDKEESQDVTANGSEASSLPGQIDQAAQDLQASSPPISIEQTDQDLEASSLPTPVNQVAQDLQVSSLLRPIDQASQDLQISSLLRPIDQAAQDQQAQEDELRELGINVVDQLSLERNVEAAVSRGLLIYSIIIVHYSETEMI